MTLLAAARRLKRRAESLFTPLLGHCHVTSAERCHTVAGHANGGLHTRYGTGD